MLRLKTAHYALVMRSRVQLKVTDCTRMYTICSHLQSHRRYIQVPRHVHTQVILVLLNLRKYSKVLCAQSSDHCAELESEVCTIKSSDGTNPYFVHNIYTHTRAS